LRLIAVILALFFTGSAMADDWKDYDNDVGIFSAAGRSTVASMSRRLSSGR
jgi:hypothetical protein